MENGPDAERGSNVKEGSRQYLTFRVARRDLALDAGRVRAILPARDLEPMASVRPGVLGVVHLSGDPVVVVDLRTRLALEASASRAPQYIVVVEAAGGRLAGFLVDRVTDLIRYRSRDVRNGTLRGTGRTRRLVEVDQVVAEDDLVRLWSPPA